MENKKIKTFDLRFWVFLAFFGLCVTWICYLPVWFTSRPSVYDFLTTGAIGDTIGGTMGPFVAIAAAILTFLAFWVQYKANEQQKQDMNEQKDKAKIEGLETRFMDMVKMHRDNVQELTFTTYSRNTKSLKEEEEIFSEHTARLRKVFKEIFDQFKSLNKELSHFFADSNPETIYENVYLEKLRTSIQIQDRNIGLIALAKIDILYCIIYFGLGSDDSDTIESFFINRYKSDFYKSLLRFASLKPKVESDYWHKWEEYNDLPIFEKMKYLKYWEESDGDNGEFSSKIAKVLVAEKKFFHDLNSKNSYNKYYGGHQFRLGHYFRHLYQSVNIIDKSKLLDYDEKYNNIKLLRGQLSTYEQIMFFLNSISILGRVWELEPKSMLSDSKKHENWLVTKYNLIKNIAKDELIDGILVTDFYPLVSYEANFKPELNLQRETLRQKYSSQ